MKEKDLFPPLKKWFNSRGYKVYSEVPNMGNSIDVVADNGHAQIACEMKTALTKKVVNQANYGKIRTGIAYVVIPTIPRTKNIHYCRDRGIGILQILDNKCFILLEPKKEKPFPEDFRFDFTGWSEGTESGNPCLKGEGITYAILEEIQKYLKLHSKATWKEIYNNVTNHYSSHNSMANSMRKWRNFTLR